jgi:hypothetical protein
MKRERERASDVQAHKNSILDPSGEERREKSISDR